MTTNTLRATARHETLDGIVTLLQAHRTAALDYIVPAQALRADRGRLVVDTDEVNISDVYGVVPVGGSYRLNRHAAGGLADKLGLPGAVRFLRGALDHDRIDIWDNTVNAVLHGGAMLDQGTYPALDARWLLRILRTGGQLEDGADGLIRAVLSDSYKIIDNLDVLLAVLAGIEQAMPGQRPDVDVDLTETRMIARVTAPQVAVNAADVIKDYRSPFTGNTGTENPMVWAGFVVSNSEVGSGKFAMTPRIVFEVCDNGQTITRDALETIHLGGRSTQDGLIRWSHATQRKAMELAASQASDAVAAFLTPDYVEKVLAEDIAPKYGMGLPKPAETITHVAAEVGYTEDEAAAILSRFITGGQVTAGGVMQAVTAVAQETQDGDRAFDLEASALTAMAAAARFAQAG